jgi:plastocyanin
MKKILAALTVTVIAAAAAVPALAGTKSVKVGNNYFVTPRNNATVTIQHGSTLKFVWHSNGVPHNVKKTRGPGPAFHSPVKTGGSYSHKFTRGGTYKLVCTILTGMKLTVKVR